MNKIVAAGLCLCILGPMSGVHAVVPEGFFDMIVSDPQSALATFRASKFGFTDEELNEAEAQRDASYSYLDRTKNLYDMSHQIRIWDVLGRLYAAIEREKDERGVDALRAAGLWDPVKLFQEEGYWDDHMIESVREIEARAARTALERKAWIAAAPAAAPAAPLVAPPLEEAAVRAPGEPIVSEAPVSDDDNKPGSAAAADG